MSTSSEQLMEEQEEFLKSLEEEFKDRYTEKEEGYKVTLERTSPSPPVVENWRDFGRRDNRRRDDRRRDDRYRDDRYRDRNRDGNWNREYNERYRYGDRYSHSSRHDYNRYREQNHYPNDNRWH